MARVFVEYKSAAFTSDGQIILQFHVTYIDPAQQLVSPSDITVTVLATDAVTTIRTKVTTAISDEATRIGLTVTAAEMILPAYSKG